MPPGSVAVVLETSGDHMKLVFFSHGEQANGFYKGASDIELVTEHVDG